MIKKFLLPSFIFLLFLLITRLWEQKSTPAFAAVSHIVISQVQIHGPSLADDEFVELYNPTNNPVDLTSKKLTRKNSTGTEQNLVASMSGTIAPHAYFLIGSAAYAGATTKDLSYSNNSNNLTNNYSVRLIESDGTTVIDRVGMGTNTDFETAAIDNPVDGGSIQRKLDDTGGHGLDTENNSTDFEEIALSTPRNSSTVVVTPTATLTGNPTPTLTGSVSPTTTPTGTPTVTETSTPSPTNSPTNTPSTSPSPSPTSTPSSTLTPTNNPTSTPTVTPTNTATPTIPSTITVTPTLSVTPTSTVTPTPTPIPTGGQVLGSFPFPGGTIVCTLEYKRIRGPFFPIYLPFVHCSHIHN